MKPERRKKFTWTVRLCSLFLCTVFLAKGQTNTALGTWRLHLSYYDVGTLELTDKSVFAATANGIIIYNKEEASLSSLNTLNGLSGTGITSLGFDPINNVLLIGYEDGNLDMLSGNTITNFSRLRESDLAGKKNISHIATRNGEAYLATPYGVVIFNTALKQVKETWRDLGPGGEPLAVYQSTFLNDSIFLATANGVLAGNLNDNLLDYNNWKRYNTGDLAGAIRSITSFHDKIYAATQTGVSGYGDGRWDESILSGIAVQSLSSSANYLFAIGNRTIYSLDEAGALSEISYGIINTPTAIAEDANGSFWIGDADAGLLSNVAGDFSTYNPNGPATDSVFRLVSALNRIFALPGGFSDLGQPLGLAGQLSIFENGAWSVQAQPVNDVTDLALFQDKSFVSSFAQGIAATDATGAVMILNESNSPLNSSVDDSPKVTSLHVSAEGLWVGLYNGQDPVHVLRNDGSWESFSFGLPNERAPIDLSVDSQGNLWMLLNPATGGGLVAYDIQRDQAFYKSTTTGQGALPHQKVNCIDLDRDGYPWIGTDAGVAYFFSASQDAIRPVFENRFLLRDEKVTAIEIDGGNRKWIGTERGAWLFNDTGESLIHHFTTENSPLLSNLIKDIEIDPLTGEVFMATSRGIASYRSDATDGGEQFQSSIKIFPNPVQPGYAGTVGISGLPMDATVKITDVRGKLVWETRANGGTAGWNVRDHSGKRASTGVYLVFAIASDGTESLVGKVAVIE